MRIKAAIPRKSASMALLRPSPKDKISFFDYDILVLRRHEKMTFASALVFPGGSVEKEIDQNYRLKYSLPSKIESTVLRETFEETGLFFSNKPIVESEKLTKLNHIRLNYSANLLNGVPNAKEKSFKQLSQLLLPTTNMVPFIRMITIPTLKRRYDTTFYILPLNDYKYINFNKYAEHQKYLHNLDLIDHCKREYTDFRWMNPAEILTEHFNKKSIIAPPQFIMLNIMLKFQKRNEFVQYLKSINNPANRGFTNYNLGPNVISLIQNKGNQKEKYPFAATLVGDRQFPYQNMLENESCEELREEVHHWMRRSQEENAEYLIRFLFKEGKRFFESEFDVVCNSSDSVIGEMKGWRETKQALSTLIV